MVMNNFKSFLSKASALSLNKQFIFFVGIGFTIILLVFSINWVKTPVYTPLFSSLSSMDERNVVKLLDANGISYKFSPASGIVLVSESKINRARMIMAQHGLPSTAHDAYDLLNKNQGIYTSQMNEDLIKKRILEENLQHVIETINGIQAAKVQLALPHHTDFMQKIIHPKASIVVRLAPGVVLSDEQVRGISYLVSSSIPYMKPNEVTIVDQTGELLSSSNAGQFSLTSDQLKYRQQLENNLRDQILSVLAPVLGRQNIHVQVNANLNFDAKENTTESYMPDKKSIQSEEIEKSIENNPSAGAQGVPGALSNQPPRDGKLTDRKSNSSGGSSSDSNSPDQISKHDRETYNYSLGKSITHVNYSPGFIRNLTVAIVLNDKKVTTKKGNEYIALKPEEITKLTALAKDAIGFDEFRGDKISVVNERFFTNELTDVKKVSTPITEQPWFLEMIKGVLFLIGFTIFTLLIWRPFYGRLFATGLPATTDNMDQNQPDDHEKTPNYSANFQNNDFDSSVKETKQVFQNSPDVAANVIKKWLRSSE